MERNRYADLLRAGAVGTVVLGHWLLTNPTYQNGQLSGQDALQYVAWGRWLTLLFQVMPAVFLVGGFANAVSWTEHRSHGGDWVSWVRRRALRLLWPATVYLAAAFLGVTAARASGAGAIELALTGWYIALHLWFLPVYLLLIALTPVLLAAHHRWGLRVPFVMAVAAAAVDLAALGPRLPVVGFANYLLVWGSMHQWGFTWYDGQLTSGRRPFVLAAAGTVLLAGLLAWGPFPVDMVGTGSRAGNTTPPSIALLARLNRAVMTVYLWHPVPVVVVAITFYPSGIAPQPAVGSWQWWALRPLWLAVLALLIVPLTLAVQRAQRPLRRLAAGPGGGGRGAAVLLACGLAVVLPALARLAVGGFAPAGRVAWGVLALYVGGFLLVLFSCSRRRRSGRLWDVGLRVRGPAPGRGGR
ncbi:acyltransferase [Kitasatospora aureofaciens]|uniref:Acyltransferase n=1 Tax=Kitasatospora aureofaciens TaxID=1894 RepID=A0A1E7NFU2_KITAU|nr:acyltransferase family protein [Kitasatospora aureofaciens]OEV39518.1 acyltransferase [Kitasatospora aureofaciens]